MATTTYPPQVTAVAAETVRRALLLAGFATANAAQTATLTANVADYVSRGASGAWLDNYAVDQARALKTAAPVTAAASVSAPKPPAAVAPKPPTGAVTSAPPARSVEVSGTVLGMGIPMLLMIGGITFLFARSQKLI